MGSHPPRRRIAGARLTVATLLVTAASAAQAPPPDPPPPLLPWYEAIELGAFVDAYASVNYGFPKPQTGTNRLRAYDASNGFALSWVGADARYDPDPIGGTIELRFGPTAELHAGPDRNTALEFVKQAHASWRPGGADGPLQLDFGKFDAIYGVEVAESQQNWNYTRGALYWLVQPRFLTGLHAAWRLAAPIELHALVVNGQNRSLDNNIGKTFGAQLRVRPTSWLGAALGWIGGPEQDDTQSVPCPADSAYSPEAAGCTPELGTPAATYTVDRGGANDFDAFRHLVDLVIMVQATETLEFVLNGDYGWEGVRRLETPSSTLIDTKRWYGAMLAARWQATAVWAVAARGEYLADADGHLASSVLPAAVTSLSLATATLTLEAAVTEHLLLRLEGRGDFALDAEPTSDVFAEDVRGGSSAQVTTTLGVVVKTQ
jgi:hypothetical protein